MNAPEPSLGNTLAPSTPAWCDDGFSRNLGAGFAIAQAPQALPQAHWIARNAQLADELGLADWLHSDDALAMLSGASQAPGGNLATVYSGHQFGVWAGQLGDGRALLLGEVHTPQGRMELQLKGSGVTPFSRGADGRAVLRSSIREFLCSEAMHGLGIPTTRALAMIGSPLPVRRETVETAAIVTRVAPSFLRFGHFEHLAHTAPDDALLRQLADGTIQGFYPAAADAANPYAALLEAVTLRTAALIAQWQAVGFCHGVMNTDNMSMLGLTIDYGPFGFLDGFDPKHICNHSDHHGRYTWAQQPNIALWNLHALAQGLMPLIGDSDAALAALEPFKTAFPQALLSGMRAKLGLLGVRDDDRMLADDLLRLMAAERTDFSILFRRLCHFDSAAGAANEPLHDLFIDRAAFGAWADRYRLRLEAEHSIDAERALRMTRCNPKYMLRNHLAEGAIQQARVGNFSEVHRLLKILQNPFDEQPESEADAGLPPDWAQQLEVSCSS
jgi:serine/tyrosine/threonine adenylyltransferase